MLYLSDSSFDFSEIVNECLSLVYVALLGKKFVDILITYYIFYLYLPYTILSHSAYRL